MPDQGIIRVTDCSKGMSDWYPTQVGPEQIELAWDIEFCDCAVGNKRPGVREVVTNRPSGELQESLFVHTPTPNHADDRLMHADRVTSVRAYDATYAVTLLTNSGDTFDFSKGVDWASLHGKLFIAAKSNVNRLHVWVKTDGNAIRRTGLTAPIAGPVVTNQGSGTFSGQRQYRVRYATAVAGAVARRSEPSPATTFTPSGTGAAARITKPASVNEGETGWEIEELAPSGDWFRIATLPVGTTTFDDTLALSAVATNGVLSEDIGDYQLQYAARWLTVDEDRLILGGSHDEDALTARVSWTALGGAFGVGNDERLPKDIEGFIDFDALDGGGLTGIYAWQGKVVVFKMGQVHQMVRSSSRTRGYISDVISRLHGAIPFSIVEGTDDQGLSCLYFLDQYVGPMQLGVRGLRVLCPHLERTWTKRVSLDATRVAAVTYHPEKRQVWWHVCEAPTGTWPTYPSIRWMYTVETDGLVFHSLNNGQVASAVLWLGKPHLLYANTPFGSGALWNVPIAIGRADEDGLFTDLDFRYRALIRTRAFQPGNVVRRIKVDAAVVELFPWGTQLSLQMRGDFGRFQHLVDPITPQGGGTWEAVPLDNAYSDEVHTIQFEISDSYIFLPGGRWEIHGLTAVWSLASPMTGRG